MTQILLSLFNSIEVFLNLAVIYSVCNYTVASGGDGKMARILVVDDEQMIGEIASRILKRAGHQVITALSGNEALNLLMSDASTIDVLLIDETMPGLSARETIREILQKQPNVRTIVSSGYKVDYESYAKEFGNSLTALPKPYRSEQLTQAVANSLAP